MVHLTGNSFTTTLTNINKKTTDYNYRTLLVKQKLKNENVHKAYACWAEAHKDVIPNSQFLTDIHTFAKLIVPTGTLRKITLVASSILAKDSDVQRITKSLADHLHMFRLGLITPKECSNHIYEILKPYQQVDAINQIEYNSRDERSLFYVNFLLPIFEEIRQEPGGIAKLHDLFIAKISERECLALKFCHYQGFFELLTKFDPTTAKKVLLLDINNESVRVPCALWWGFSKGHITNDLMLKAFDLHTNMGLIKAFPQHINIFNYESYGDAAEQDFLNSLEPWFLSHVGPTDITKALYILAYFARSHNPTDNITKIFVYLCSTLTDKDLLVFFQSLTKDQLLDVLSIETDIKPDSGAHHYYNRVYQMVLPMLEKIASTPEGIEEIAHALGTKIHFSKEVITLYDVKPAIPLLIKLSSIPEGRVLATNVVFKIMKLYDIDPKNIDNIQPALDLLHTLITHVDVRNKIRNLFLTRSTTQPLHIQTRLETFLPIFLDLMQDENPVFRRAHYQHILDLLKNKPTLVDLLPSNSIVHLCTLRNGEGIALMERKDLLDNFHWLLSLPRVFTTALYFNAFDKDVTLKAAGVDFNPMEIVKIISEIPATSLTPIEQINKAVAAWVDSTQDREVLYKRLHIAMGIGYTDIAFQKLRSLPRGEQKSFLNTLESAWIYNILTTKDLSGRSPIFNANFREYCLIWLKKLSPEQAFYVISQEDEENRTPLHSRRILATFIEELTNLRDCIHPLQFSNFLLKKDMQGNAIVHSPNRFKIALPLIKKLEPSFQARLLLEINGKGKRIFLLGLESGVIELVGSESGAPEQVGTESGAPEMSDVNSLYAHCPDLANQLEAEIAAFLQAQSESSKSAPLIATE